MKIFGKRLRRNQRGFTLVELLVVVGIIVALAAVIIPNVASFSDRGETGAQAAEEDNIQASIDLMMTDTSTTSVTANNLGTTGDGSNDFSAATGIVNLETGGAGAPYLRTTTTTYWYCWDTTGLITEQILTTTTACAS